MSHGIGLCSFYENTGTFERRQPPVGDIADIGHYIVRRHAIPPRICSKASYDELFFQD